MRPRFKINPAVQWYEGMMLAPHHFQQQELRAYQVSSTKFQLLNPFFYGFTNFVIDEAALAAGQFNITGIEGILPDGEIITINNPMQIALASYKTHRASDFTVWLGIQPWTTTSSPLNKDAPRYTIVDGEEVPSNEDAANIIPISRLLPVVSLYIAPVAAVSLVSMPIAKILCVDNVFSLAKYVAPCFGLSDATIIVEELQQCSVLARTKEAHLLKKYETVFGTAQEMWVATMLNAVRGAATLLETVVNNAIMHPFDAYRILCQSVSVLACLRHLDPAPVIPAYDHNQLYHAFSLLSADIKKSLESVTALYRYVPFDLVENVFSLYVTSPTNKLLLSITFKEEKHVRGDWIHSAIIVSDSEIDTAIKERITGAKRRVLKTSEYPNDLYDIGDLLVEVEIDERYVFNGRKLILFNPIDEVTPENIAWCMKE